MGQKILLDVSPTGVQHSIEIDPDGDGMLAVEFTPTRIENEILDSCAELRGMHQRAGAAFKLAARIPLLTWEMWRKEWAENYSDVYTWPQYEVIKLNNRDNSKLRTGFKRSGSMLL